MTVRDFFALATGYAVLNGRVRPEAEAQKRNASKNWGRENMTMRDPLMLNCGIHGERISAVVCKHMLRNEPAPSGFIENSSAPDDLQAWCHLCEDKFEQEGEMTEAFRAFNDMTLVCIDCYIEAKARHSLPSN